MNFAILRIAKLKTAQNIASSAHHCFRSRETLNADPARADKNQFFGARSASAVRQAVRKTAVMCVEYMITVSPEVFERDPQRVTRYLRDAHKWLIAQHGAGNVIGGGIHYDEKTPHLSAYVVPIDPKGKLNASHFFDGREKLSDFQTRFWESVGKPYGLDRGIEGSTAKHTTLKQYYSALKSDLPAVLVTATDTEPRVTEKRLLRDKKENPDQVSKRINATVEKKIKPKKPSWTRPNTKPESPIWSSSALSRRGCARSNSMQCSTDSVQHVTPMTEKIGASGAAGSALMARSGTTTRTALAAAVQLTWSSTSSSWLTQPRCSGSLMSSERQRQSPPRCCSSAIECVM